MESFNHTQLFDDYLDDIMSADEVITFEERLVNELDFKASFEKHKELRNAIVWTGAQDLKAQIKEAEQAHFKMKVLKSPEKKSNYRILAIAASLLILVGAFFFIKQSGSGSSAQDLYAAYYEPYSPNTGVRGNDVAKSIQDFDKAYKAKNYAEALNLLNVIQQEKETLDWNLYKAICLMETGSMDEAEKILIGLDQGGSSLLSHEAKWYLSMLNLKQGAVEKASVYLKQMAASTNGDHSLEAKKILEQID